MVDCLKAWGRERGWRRVEAASCPDVVPFRALGSHILRRSSWEKRGFRVVEEKPTVPEDAARRRTAIEQILAGNVNEDDWDVRSYSHDLERVKMLARDRSWQDVCDKTYIMACDLNTP